MTNFKQVIYLMLTLVLWSVMGSLSSDAQNLSSSNLTHSPYTRYGYGELGTKGNAATRAMGDVGIGYRTTLYTNLSNPASLTAIDTLTMLFEVGLDAQYVRSKENGVVESKWDAGFGYMSFHFPLWRNFAASLSLSPYSTVGYYFGNNFSEPLEWDNKTQQHKDTLHYSQVFAGMGGISNFMLGVGWRAFRTKHHEANLGFNVGYLWGSINHSSSLAVTSSQATSTVISHTMSARGLYLKFGAQYTWRPSAIHSVTIGATYTPQLNLGVDAETMKLSTDTIIFDGSFRRSIKSPMSLGIGGSYVWRQRLTVAGEWEHTNWDAVNGLDASHEVNANLFKDVNRVALGFDFLPKLYSNHFFQTCHYRAGFTMQNSYVTINGSDFKEYGASVGIGMPMNKRSAFDFTIGYSHRAPSSDGMVSENSLKFTVGITFNEMMFFRSRLR